MKYIYYYIWILNCTFSYFFIKKPIFWLTENIGTKVLKLKKLEDKKVKKGKLDFNKTSYDFPDGISHWYTFGVFFLLVSILLYFIPLIYWDLFNNFVGITWYKHILALSPSLIISYYIIYVNKKNKEWLKKKIGKKKKDFYIK